VFFPADLEVIFGVQGLRHVMYFALCFPNPISGEAEADFFFFNLGTFEGKVDK